jgi:amidase
MSADILDLDATGQLTALAGRRISAVELLQLSLAREAQTHGRLNAVVTRDPERALFRAEAIDDLRAKGAPLGVLAGLPMTIKDTLDVVGMPATSGLNAFKVRTAEDAVAVAHAKAAGAVIWGKTNVPVMAGDWQSFNDLYGTSNNPWDVSRTTGGSSGGAASALATGVTALEIGSDIGGSLRVPASFCGVFSHKPTWGLVSQIGHVPPQPGARSERDLNVIGPMARSARDLRLLFGVICDAPSARLGEAADLATLKVGLWLDEPAFPLDPQVRAALERLAVELAGQGAVVETISSPVPAEQLMGAYQVLLGAIIGTDMPPAQQRQMARMRGLARITEGLGVKLSPELAQLRAYTATHAEWLEADETRARLREGLSSVFSRFDVILAPVSAVPAFPHDHRPFQSRRLKTSDGREIPYVSMLNWIALATACQLPATCVPAGLTHGGLPVGAQIIGPRGGDAKTLAVAQAIDENIRGFVPPPKG